MPISIRIAGDVRIAGIIKISYYSRQGFIRGSGNSLQNRYCSLLQQQTFHL